MGPNGAGHKEQLCLRRPAEIDCYAMLCLIFPEPPVLYKIYPLRRIKNMDGPWFGTGNRVHSFIRNNKKNN
jgi:hypothetical protein